MNPIAEPSLIALLQETALFLWKEWPRDMEIVTVFPNAPGGGSNFTLRGTCPHCNKGSGFIPHGGSYIEHRVGSPSGIRWMLALECQTCTKFILAVAFQQHPQNPHTLRYETHYPLGEPDDTVAAEIPEHIAEDFKEALRCQWVKAYSATAEMCRRALEGSCLDLGAHKKRVLQKMIDELEEKRVITPALKNAAHKIRLGGDRGAHPPEDGPTPTTAEDGDLEDGPVEKIGEKHAAAIVEFTRHFFQHVYVIPKQLDQYDFSKPKAQIP